MDRAISAGTAVGVSPLPDDLVSEVLRPEDVVEEKLQVVTCRWVAVNVQRAVAPENSMRLGQPGRHLHEIRGGRPRCLRKKPDEVSGRPGEELTEPIKCALGDVSPAPSVRERGLHLLPRGSGRTQNRAIAAAGVEWRIEIGERYRPCLEARHALEIVQGPQTTAPATHSPPPLPAGSFEERLGPVAAPLL